MKNEVTVVILRMLADKLLLDDYEEGDSEVSRSAVAQGINITLGDNCGVTGHAVIHVHDGMVEIVGGSFYVQDEPVTQKEFCIE